MTVMSRADERGEDFKVLSGYIYGETDEKTRN
jgi:hypothetical protein